MKRHLMALSLGIGAMFIATQNGHAQSRPNCAQRDMVIQRLTEVYGESRQSIGMGNNKAVVEIFASVASGTWTITVTVPGGKMCVVAAGQGYEFVAEGPVAPGNDA